MRLCICGNELGDDPGFRVTHSPCRCDDPGTGPRQTPCHDLPRCVSKQQYEERKRVGLPVVSGIERPFSRWV